jgi:hypothetical protein
LNWIFLISSLASSFSSDSLVASLAGYLFFFSFFANYLAGGDFLGEAYFGEDFFVPASIVGFLRKLFLLTRALFYFSGDLDFSFAWAFLLAADLPFCCLGGS